MQDPAHSSSPVSITHRPPLPPLLLLPLPSAPLLPSPLPFTLPPLLPPLSFPLPPRPPQRQATRPLQLARLRAQTHNNAPGLLLLSENAQGLNDTEKLSGLFQDLKNSKADVVFLQETKIKSNDDFSKKRWRGKSAWGCAAVAARGTAILLPTTSKCTPDLGRALTNPRYTILPATWGKENLLLISVYAPNERVNQLGFFSELSTRLLDSDLLDDNPSVILAGDFNSVEDPEVDKLGGAQSSGHPSTLDDLLDLLDLQDAFRVHNPTEKEFTWSNATTSTRIDKIFVSPSLLPRTKISHEHNPWSDHKAVRCNLAPADGIAFGRGTWALNLSLLSDPNTTRDLVDLFHHTALNPDLSASDKLMLIKQEASQRLQNLGKQKAVEARAVMFDLNQALRTKERTLLADPTNTTTRTDIKAIKNRIHAMARKKALWKSRKASGRFLDLGDRCTKYFAAFAKLTTPRTSIQALEENGTVHENTRDILASAGRYYADLFSPKPTDPEATSLLLSGLTRTLSAVDAQKVEGPITIDEVKESINTAAKDRAPGPDGLPTEFWQHFSSLDKVLCAAFNEWFDQGVIPDQEQVGTISLIFKKGAPQLISNYRPITLLNTSLKILTRILTRRVQKVVHAVVSPSQTAVPGRFIGTNIRLISDLLSTAKDTKAPTGILLLDKEKAFDRLSWEYMTKVLEAKRFGPDFRKWIAILYHASSSRLKINNELSDPIPLRCGVHQGDPLAPLLYVICDDPLIEAIDQDQNIKGVRLGTSDTWTKTSAFADDLAVLPSCDQDIQAINRHLLLYEKASGAKFNRAKTEAVVYHFQPTPCDLFPTYTTDSDHTFRYLGVTCGLNLDLAAAWREPVAKYTACLERWKRVATSLTGRIVALKSFALPILTYTASALPIPRSILDEIDKLAWKFLWVGRRRARVNKDTCQLPREFGGLGYPDIPAQFQRLHVKWVTRLLTALEEPAPPPWTILAKTLIGTVDNEFGHGLTCLLNPGSRKDADKTASPFWAAATRAFWATNPHYNLTDTNPRAPLLARSTPIFNSGLILRNEKPLKGKRWKDVAAKGVTRLCDLVHHDRFLTAEELAIPLRVYNDLMSAIPQYLKELILQHPPAAVHPTWDRKEVFVSDVVHDQPDRPHPPKHQTTWDLEIRPPPLKTIKWRSVHTRLWKAPVPSKAKELAWLLIRRSLLTGDKALRLSIATVPPECGHCAELETLDHLFLDCQEVKETWRWLGPLWQKATHTQLGPLTWENLILATDRPPPVLSPAWSTITVTLVWAIWRSRCLTQFGGQPTHLLPLFKNILKRILTSQLHSRSAPSLPRLVWTKDGAFGRINGSHQFVFSF